MLNCFSIKKSYCKVQILLIFILISCTFCNLNKRENEIKIFPIHPFAEEGVNYLQNTKNLYKIKYYVVETNESDTNIIGNKIDKFIEDSINNDFLKYDLYSVWFFKSRKGFDKNFIETNKDIMQNHEKDMLLEYFWKDREYFSRDFYKDGEIISNKENLQKVIDIP